MDEQGHFRDRSDRPWFEQAFGPLYPVLYQHRDDESAATEVSYVVRRWNLDPSELVLDLGCGTGRHLTALQEQGVLSVGLDLSRDLLARAQERGCRNLVRGDMRALPFSSGVFSGVLSFFTSFGYFDDPREDLTVLGEVRRVLAPSGRYLLDYLDADWVRRNLQPSSERRAGGYHVQEQRAIRRDRVEKTVTVKEEASGAQILTYRESVRLYTAGQLVEMLESVGFRVLDQTGALADIPAGQGSRCVLFAEVRL